SLVVVTPIDGLIFVDLDDDCFLDGRFLDVLRGVQRSDLSASLLSDLFDLLELLSDLVRDFIVERAQALDGNPRAFGAAVDRASDQVGLVEGTARDLLALDRMRRRDRGEDLLGRSRALVGDVDIRRDGVDARVTPRLMPRVERADDVGRSRV